MSTRMIAGTIMSAVLLAAVLLVALRGCEESSPAPNEPIQYENTHEETTPPESVQYSNEHIQYHSVELPDTSGIRLW